MYSVTILARMAQAGVWLGCLTAWASDWPQFRGPAGDGTTPDPIATAWATNTPGFVVWTNMSLTNGFSSFAVSQGRAFTLISKGSPRLEYCVAVDAATGANLWSTPIDTALNWDPTAIYNGGEGLAPCYKGDGPRTTPSVKDGRVFALSGHHLNLVCCNATNGTVIWSNNLYLLYGATTLTWENGASPRLDNDLIFVNLHTATANLTLAAFNTSNGALVWQSQDVRATQSTPTVATIEGVRQVIFATTDGLVSLDRNTGGLLWTYPYPFGTVDTAMGASPGVSSNIVFLTAAYGARGAAAARVTRTNGTWTVTHLWFKTSQSGVTFKSTWMTPVCYEGHLYGMFGDKNYSVAPLNCIELATGALKWSVPNFGMGGISLVDGNLLVATEDAQVVLVAPTPSAYTELARYRAFQFTASTPGKCWSIPAYSDGRIYLRSTRGGISLNVAPPPRLKLFTPQVLSSNQLRLMIGTASGSPIDAARLPGIGVHATNNLSASPASWPRLTNPLALTTNGLVVMTNVINGGRTQSFYMTIEHP
jgi:outer membrane protein assembly factor BamB